jgi:hypothetical protein
MIGLSGKRQVQPDWQRYGRIAEYAAYLKPSFSGLVAASFPRLMAARLTPAEKFSSPPAALRGDLPARHVRRDPSFTSSALTTPSDSRPGKSSYHGDLLSGHMHIGIKGSRASGGG